MWDMWVRLFQVKETMHPKAKRQQSAGYRQFYPAQDSQPQPMYSGQCNWRCAGCVVCAGCVRVCVRERERDGDCKGKDCFSRHVDTGLD